VEVFTVANSQRSISISFEKSALSTRNARHGRSGCAVAEREAGRLELPRRRKAKGDVPPKRARELLHAPHRAEGHRIEGQRSPGSPRLKRTLTCHFTAVKAEASRPRMELIASQPSIGCFIAKKYTNLRGIAVPRPDSGRPTSA